MIKKATVCFLLREGEGGQTEVLLGKRNASFMKGFWNGPGGKHKPDESGQRCVVRESIEEISVKPLDPQHIATLHSYHPTEDGDGHYLACIVDYYLAGSWQGEPRVIEGEGFSELRWFSLKALPVLEMIPDQRYWLFQVLEQMLNGDQHRPTEIKVWYKNCDLTHVESIEIRFLPD